MSIKIEYKHGNLLDVTSGHISQSCNSQGIMGAGAAAAIKEKYPICFKEYREEYEKHGLQLGDVVSYIESNFIIWNIIGQHLDVSLYRYPFPDNRMTSYDALQTGLAYIDSSIKILDHLPKVLNLPFIGAGLGKGHWPIIEKIIEETMSCQVIVWSLDGKMLDGSDISI